MAEREMAEIHVQPLANPQVVGHSSSSSETVYSTTSQPQVATNVTVPDQQPEIQEQAFEPLASSQPAAVNSSSHFVTPDSSQHGVPIHQEEPAAEDIPIPPFTDWRPVVPHVIEYRLPTGPPTIKNIAWFALSVLTSLSVYVILLIKFNKKKQSVTSETTFNLELLIPFIIQFIFLFYCTAVRPELRGLYPRVLLGCRYLLELIASYVSCLIARDVKPNSIWAIWVFVLAAAYFLAFNKIVLPGFDFWITIVLVQVAIGLSLATKNVGFEFVIGVICFVILAIRFLLVESGFFSLDTQVMLKTFQDIKIGGYKKYQHQVQIPAGIA